MLYLPLMRMASSARYHSLFIDQLEELAARVPERSLEEQKELILKAKTGDEKATQALVEMSYTSVVRLAKKYSRYNSELIDDMASSGIEGVHEAIQKCEVDKLTENGFGAYATHRIRDRILDTLSESRSPLSGVTAQTYSLAQRIGAYERSLEEQTGVNHTAEDICYRFKVSPERKRTLENLSQRAISMEEPTEPFEGQERTFADVIADENTEGFQRNVDNQEDGRLILKIIAEKLTPQQQLVLSEHFGLTASSKEKQLNEISTVLNLSQERVFQIKEKAIGEIQFALGLKKQPPKRKKTLSIKSILKHSTPLNKKRLRKKRREFFGAKRRYNVSTQEVVEAASSGALVPKEIAKSLNVSLSTVFRRMRETSPRLKNQLKARKGSKQAKTEKKGLSAAQKLHALDDEALIQIIKENKISAEKFSPNIWRTTRMNTALRKAFLFLF
mgnify:CR=1 FL=1